MPSKFMAICLALTLTSCAAMHRTPVETATVTGVSTGRASVPNESVYVLRSAKGRVYMTPQVIENPPQVGALVEIERTGKGGVRIVGTVER